MHERLIGRGFKKAERRHLEVFQQQGKVINERPASMPPSAGR
jgi:hypothetical protein